MTNPAMRRLLYDRRRPILVMLRWRGRQDGADDSRRDPGLVEVSVGVSALVGAVVTALAGIVSQASKELPFGAHLLILVPCMMLTILSSWCALWFLAECAKETSDGGIGPLDVLAVFNSKKEAHKLLAFCILAYTITLLVLQGVLLWVAMGVE